MESDDSALIAVDPQRPYGPGSGGVTGRGFLPGQSGNPGGRAKGEPSLAAIRRRRLGDPIAGTPWAIEAAQRLGLGDGATFADLLIETELYSAIACGNVRALASVSDRMDGKPRQSVTLTGGEQAGELVITATFAEYEGPAAGTALPNAAEEARKELLTCPP